MKNVLLGLLILAGTVSQAATVRYNESTNGDLVYITDPAVHDPFILDVGLNTFSGSMDEVARDRDTIYFAIADGLSLVSAHLTYWYSIDSYDNTSYFSLQKLSSGGGGMSLGDDVIVGNEAYCLLFPDYCDSSSAFHWASGLPSGGAEYLLQPGNIGANGNSTLSTLHYDWEIQVIGAAVPVPAAVWLFGSALGLLGWMRRKAA
jgi:hypothetical protein